MRRALEDFEYAMPHPLTNLRLVKEWLPPAWARVLTWLPFNKGPNRNADVSSAEAEMTKRISKKISIIKESLRILVPSDLAAAKGGGGYLDDLGSALVATAPSNTRLHGCVNGTKDCIPF